MPFSLIHNMHFILISGLEIKNGYVDSDRRWNLCSYDTAEKASFFQKCEIQISCLWDETQRGSSNILGFRKTHFCQNLISHDPEYEMLPEGCLCLMCSGSYQNHEHDSGETAPHATELLLETGWKRWEIMWLPYQKTGVIQWHSVRGGTHGVIRWRFSSSTSIQLLSVNTLVRG